MSKRFLTNLDLSRNQILNVALQNLTGDPLPANSVEGQIIYRTDLDKIKYFDGVQWVELSTAAGTVTSVFAGEGLSGGGSSGAVTLDVNVDNASLEISNDIVRIKDSGVTTAKIADGNVTTVKILDNAITFAKIQDVATMTVIGRIAAGTGDPSEIGIISDLNAASASTIVTSSAIKSYIDTAVAALGNLEGGFAAGSASQFPTGSTPTAGTKKGDYWYVTSAGTVQGVILNIGDVLIANQDNASPTNASHWIFLESNRDQATTTILGVVRLATTAEAQALVEASAVLTPASLSTITATETRTGIAEIATQAETDAGTDDQRIVTPLKLKTFFNSIVGGFAANVGNNTNVSFALSHGLNTTDVTVAIYDNATKEEVITDVVVTSAAVVTVSFATAPTNNAYRVVIKK
jgi:hypothetical protein